MLLLWVVIPVVCGWHVGYPENVFLSKVHQDVDLFHHTLFQTDSAPLASHHTDGKVVTTSGKQGSGGHSSSGAACAEGAKSENEKVSSHDKESGRKGHSGKENTNKQYEEELRKKELMHSQDEQGDEHHSAFGGEKGERFKDKLLHKKGNYEKGYRDKYHLDEVLKHDKFWSSHHSLDQYHKFGHHDADFHKKQMNNYKKDNKKSGEQSGSEGKKGETSGGHSGSEHKGHKSGGGAQSKYENKEEYQNKNVRR